VTIQGEAWIVTADFKHNPQGGEGVLILWLGSKGGGGPSPQCSDQANGRKGPIR